MISDSKVFDITNNYNIEYEKKSNEESDNTIIEFDNVVRAPHLKSGYQLS